MSRPVFLAGRGASSSGAACPSCASACSLARPRSASGRTAAFRAETAVCGEFPAGTLDSVDIPERDLPLRAALLATEEALAQAGCPEVAGMGVVLATTKATCPASAAKAWTRLPIRLGALVSRRSAWPPPDRLSCACHPA